MIFVLHTIALLRGTQECGLEDDDFLKQYPDITYVIVRLAQFWCYWINTI